MASKVAIQRSRVVIIGAGFGGLSAAKALIGGPFDVTVVDRTTITCSSRCSTRSRPPALSPADIASPIRGILRDRRTSPCARQGVGHRRRRAAKCIAEGPARSPFDYLIVATGARARLFRHDDWAPYAPGLEDHRRRHLSAPPHPARVRARRDRDRSRRAPPAAELRGRRRRADRRRDGGRDRRTRQARAGDGLPLDRPAPDARSSWSRRAARCCAPFDPSLSRRRERSLEQLGVEVRLGAGVTGCDDGGRLGSAASGSSARTIIWAAGVKASPAARLARRRNDRAGRVKVEPDLSVPGHPDIFVIGDAALATGADGQSAARRRAGREAAGRNTSPRALARPRRAARPRRRSATAISARWRPSAASAR